MCEADVIPRSEQPEMSPSHSACLHLSLRECRNTSEDRKATGVPLSGTPWRSGTLKDAIHLEAPCTKTCYENT